VQPARGAFLLHLRNLICERFSFEDISIILFDERLLEESLRLESRMLFPGSFSNIPSSTGHEYFLPLFDSYPSNSGRITVAGLILVIRWRLFKLAVVRSINASSSSFIGFSCSRYRCYISKILIISSSWSSSMVRAGKVSFCYDAEQRPLLLFLLLWLLSPGEILLMESLLNWQSSSIVLSAKTFLALSLGSLGLYFFTPAVLGDCTLAFFVLLLIWQTADFLMFWAAHISLCDLLQSNEVDVWGFCVILWFRSSIWTSIGL